MKKFILIILMLIIGISVFADMSSFNGYDWIQMTKDERNSYVLGFLSANSAIWEWQSYAIGVPDEETQLLMETMYFYEGWSIEELAQSVTKYNNTLEDKTFIYIEQPIYLVIMYIGGKDYWNWKNEVNYNPSES